MSPTEAVLLALIGVGVGVEAAFTVRNVSVIAAMSGAAVMKYFWNSA